MNREWPSTPVIIVSYRTADDVAGCLETLDALHTETDISVHICENGGAGAWDNLCAALLRPGGPCQPADDLSFPFGTCFNRIACLRLRRSGSLVLVGEARKFRLRRGDQYVAVAAYKAFRLERLLDPQS